MTATKLLRTPTKQDLTDSQMAHYIEWLPKHGYPKFESYPELHRWSVDQLETFWETIYEWGGLIAQTPYSSVLKERKMPGARWFEGAMLNFAENLLCHAEGELADTPALTSISETRARSQLTYRGLREKVAGFASFLRTQGVKKGDRVAAITANTEEPIIAMLATTSLGAVWSSCSPDFGVQGIFDRFGQIAPKVLIAVNGYKYNGKSFDCLDRVKEILKKVPSIQTTVIVPFLEAPTKMESSYFDWEQILEESPESPLSFESVPFEHPIYILYSSGTTGLPKCIVHGGGGVLLQHAKELRLHTNVQPGDHFFYFTTCGWMMWNWLVSGLMGGANLILFDGAPMYPDKDRLWAFAEEEKIHIFGTSAKFIGACRSSKLSPKSKFDLSPLRTILSTGSPLLPEDFDWIYSAVKRDVVLSSIAGGTDIVSCFVGGNPMLPVFRGEIQCRGLGMAAEAYNEEGKRVIDEQGELVCEQPSPSMPIYFWNDKGDRKYRKAYFERFPGIWTHGDYVEFTRQGGCIMLGRSDATLNPGGVRIGTADIYRPVETLEEVVDSLCVGKMVDGDEQVILFVLLRQGETLTEDLTKKIKKRIRERTTPRHVPSKILQVKEIPYTISGKKVELAVKKILHGQKVENRDALANPHSLDQFENLPKLG